MNEGTLIAVLVLCFVFGLLCLAYHKRGVEDLTKVWGLFGPIAGAIVSFYFTAKAGDAQLRTVNAENKILTSNYSEALRAAEYANKNILKLEDYVKNISNTSLESKKENNLIDNAKAELKFLEIQKISLPDSIKNELERK